MKLYGYWRSSSAWRVRIALHYKGMAYTCVPVHLLRGGGEQYAPAYLALNPLGRVPTLEFTFEGKQVQLSESVAIMELLEELQPAPPLLPTSLYWRAKVRQLTQIINSSMQPLHNVSVLNEVKRLGGSRVQWASLWLSKAFAALEKEAQKTAETCLVGHAVSMADACLVPQMAAARRFELDMEPYPLLRRVEQHLATLPAFIAAHADRQPDAQHPPSS
jgi:maleylpyruvate isomerase